MTKEQFFIGCSVCMAALSLFLVSQKNAIPPTPIDLIKVDLVSLKTEMTTLNADVSSLKEYTLAHITGINDDLFRLHSDFGLTQIDTVGFKTTDTEFQLVKTMFGYLLLQLKNCERFGNGYKLTFNFGNPTSMTISGLKGRVKWRPVTNLHKYYSDQSYKDEIDQKTNSEDFEILQDLYPGAWNTVSIVIGPASEETIGEIDVGSILSNKVKMQTVRPPS